VTSLADELDAETAIVGDRRCSFAAAVEAFPDDADAIIAKCEPGPGVTTRRAAVSRVLTRYGHPNCGVTTIDRHWRKCCACYR
jgi:hypothetical protein